MSERWGVCRRCGGHGKVVTKERDPVLLRPVENECMACGGTGESGDIQDYLEKERDTYDQSN